MEKNQYIGEVLSDGHLSLKNQVKDHLHLKPGDEVVVTLEIKAQNPLERLVGLCKEGRSDGAQRHDQYLYKEDA